MSTKRDLVEAHAFSRRRLVTAFVSGAPGGREVEPVRPGRAVVGGIAIAVLLIAGAAIAGIFKPRTPQDWLEPGMLVAKENGQGYVIVEKGKPLQPVVNATSARLMFGEDLEPKTVTQEAIDKEEIGDRIGIFGAPESLPSSGLLVGSGWTACTNEESGIKVHVDRRPDAVPTPQGALTVTVGDASFVVADTGEGAYRLPLARRDAVNVRTALNIGPVPIRPVSTAWLNLFPTGPALDLGSFDAGGGGRPSYVEDPGLRVGQLVRFSDQVFLLGKDAPMQLTPFAEAVYRALVPGQETVAEIDTIGDTDPVASPAEWPAAEPQPLAGEPCGVLLAEEGEPARTLLAADPGEDASAEGLGRQTAVSVAPSLGAYVLSAGHGVATGGQPWVIDSQGKRYGLGGPKGETASALGYGGYPAPTVPDAWIEPFGCGPELSRAAALGDPDTDTVPDECAR